MENLRDKIVCLYVHDGYRLMLSLTFARYAHNDVVNTIKDELIESLSAKFYKKVGNTLYIATNAPLANISSVINADDWIRSNIKDRTLEPIIFKSTTGRVLNFEQ